jgi:hypothetical protein
LTQYAQVPIRVALTANSLPGAPLVDLSTDSQISLYTSNDAVFQLGFFDQFGRPLDVSNLAYLEIDLLDGPCTGNVLAMSTIPGSSLSGQITWSDWKNGFAQNASVSFGQTQLQAIAFPVGQTSQLVWMVVRGITSAGEIITYGADWVILNALGVTNILLPLYPVPSVIPANTTYLIPAGVVITFSTPPQILGNLICAPATPTQPAGAFLISAY